MTTKMGVVAAFYGRQDACQAGLGTVAKPVINKYIGKLDEFEYGFLLYCLIAMFVIGQPLIIPS